MKCKNCLFSRIVASENGYHYACTLPARKAAECLTGVRDASKCIPPPELMEDTE